MKFMITPCVREDIRAPAPLVCLLCFLSLFKCYVPSLDWLLNISNLMRNFLLTALCRWGHYRITRESLVLDEGLDASPSSAPLLEEMGPSLLFGPFTICYALLSPWVHSHSRKELWSLTRQTFLSIITLGASSIRPSGFKNSSANSMQIPEGSPFFLCPVKQHGRLFSPQFPSQRPSLCRA